MRIPTSRGGTLLDLSSEDTDPSVPSGPDPAARPSQLGKTLNTADPSNKKNRYLYSFSGADCRVYTWFPSNPADIRLLPTMHTISLSVHEAKGAVRRLGHRGISGQTRAIRTIAGSMILTVINEHPLASVMAQNSQTRAWHHGWSLDKELIGKGTLNNELFLDSLLPTLLPPFDLALYYVSENANVLFSKDHPTPNRPEGAALLVKGIEFQDDGFVTSVNDMVSEVTLTFTAFDYKPLADINLEDLQEQADHFYPLQIEELQRRLNGGG